LDSNIWDSLIKIQKGLEQKFDKTGSETIEDEMERFNHNGWTNRTWVSDSYRRAHLEIVDARESKGLWVMHCCIFPHFHNTGPIFGLDIVAGKRKITGFFHDYSPTSDITHPLIKKFEDISVEYDWNKNRDLPEWARAIFTKNMIAAGNISEDKEINQIIDICQRSTDFFLNNINEFNNTEHTDSSIVAQNRYSKYQKQNPQTPRSLKSLGLDPDDVDFFVDKILFPEY
jgi:phycocyanobilin:ferredoxin oxidoreductase